MFNTGSIVCFVKGSYLSGRNVFVAIIALNKSFIVFFHLFSHTSVRVNLIEEHSSEQCLLRLFFLIMLLSHLPCVCDA